jgi:hypothetical protein
MNTKNVRTRVSNNNGEYVGIVWKDDDYTQMWFKVGDYLSNLRRTQTLISIEEFEKTEK